ncbi:interleukin-1 receptor type 1-like [Carassius carassius]|uniref:interleukin-1 receptor type 1-like n=1 Tax=Carassius carassius TaxID=217509 RepID=UPI00286886D9|nr:interleukin-1 receptor type 1-like [Carassius carassius]XP_059355436.1 interleukin-1 receptor type 1-like [Carassius carassius]
MATSRLRHCPRQNGGNRSITSGRDVLYGLSLLGTVPDSVTTQDSLGDGSVEIRSEPALASRSSSVLCGIALRDGCDSVHHIQGGAALWVRNVFPFLYKTTAGDGKQYDAYITYPRVLEGSSEKAEIFAISTLPQVLEGQHGYKLFILGRDGLPGEAVVDVVQDALSRCRRLLLLYTASSLCSPEAQDWAEQQTGLYQVLVEDSMSVVLLELEEIHQPLRLPHTVRLLKHKQGAMQAWKRRKRWPFWDRKSEERVNSLEPSGQVE